MAALRPRPRVKRGCTCTCASPKGTLLLLLPTRVLPWRGDHALIVLCPGLQGPIIGGVKVHPPCTLLLSSATPPRTCELPHSRAHSWSCEHN